VAQSSIRIASIVVADDQGSFTGRCSSASTRRTASRASPGRRSRLGSLPLVAGSGCTTEANRVDKY
jgi:hypothetical protein